MTRAARSLVRVVVAVALVVASFASSLQLPAAHADSETSGPSLTLDQTEVQPGETVVLKIAGFLKAFVTVSVCGNEARRGSADCNMAASLGLQLDFDDAPTVYKMPVAVPTTDCPCVIRVSNSATGELAVAPIVITGHPVGPIIDPPTLDGLIELTITAREAPSGLMPALRSQLGGPTTYEVTVAVRNRSAMTLQNVKVAGSAGRSAEGDLAILELGTPGAIQGGQTWRETVTVRLPAPSFGSVNWRADASGAGPTVTTTLVTEHRPVLLWLLVAVLVVMIAVVLIRMRIRRRIAAEATAAATADADAVAAADSFATADAP